MNNELNVGEVVKTINGEDVTINKELGRGGQGIVYECTFENKKYALKWYTSKTSNAFKKNLEKNILDGSPSNSFIWPLYLTQDYKKSFGYLMQLRPSGYYELSEFLLAKQSFKSVDSILTCAFKIVDGFKQIILRGLSYQDLNDGNFFINPNNGDVLICDNDNVIASGQNLGVSGKMRYMAPEIVLGKKPDKNSDLFSMAVILFLIFFRNHPFEGKKVLSSPCLTQELEKKYYGSDILFIYDKNTNENEPVRGVHKNVLNLWGAYPLILKQAFQDVFSQELLKNPQDRWPFEKWLNVLKQIRNQLIVHPSNNLEKFITEYKDVCVLEFDKDDLYTITPGKKIYLGIETNPVGEVINNQNNWQIKNISSNDWTIETPSGNVKVLKNGELMPVKPDLKISFNNNSRLKAVIKIIK